MKSNHWLSRAVNPIEARKLSIGLFLSILVSFSDTASAEVLLNEVKVIELSQTQAPALSVVDAKEDLAEQRSKTAGAYSNPSLAWSREALGGLAKGAEDVVSVTIPLDFVRPAAARSLARAESAWAKVEASLGRARLTEKAVDTYYRVVIATLYLEVLREELSNLEEGARVLARREEAGSVSGYETTRLGLEIELSKSRRAQAQGELKNAEAELSGLLAIKGRFPGVETEIDLMTPAEEARLVEGGVQEAPALKKAEASQLMAGKAQEKAEWTWLPTFELTGGVRHLTNFDGVFGYVMGLSFELPIFDRGQSLRTEANANLRLVQAQKQTLTSLLNAEVVGARAVYTNSKNELLRFEKRTQEMVTTLLAAARSGYLEGERTIVELLDAQRAQVSVEERRLTLLAAAKRSEIRLRAAVGEFQ